MNVLTTFFDISYNIFVVFAMACAMAIVNRIFHCHGRCQRPAYVLIQAPREINLTLIRIKTRTVNRLFIYIYK